tara:strand:- start:161 stop:361 length:201 start_codon:yes stop_codon:yes gene_type:complete
MKKRKIIEKKKKKKRKFLSGLSFAAIRLLESWLGALPPKAPQCESQSRILLPNSRLVDFYCQIQDW